jgi:hypothetical protein
MEIRYPIFLQDRDNYIYMISSVKELNEELENIDIEEKEYIAWDAKGMPLKLYSEQKEIKVVMLSSAPQLEELKDAILYYVRLARPKVTFVYSGPENDMVELFKAVEEHIKAGSFTHKVKHLFKK